MTTETRLPPSFGGTLGTPVQLEAPVELPAQLAELVAADPACGQIYTVFAWRNTAADAAFNTDPMTVPYSTDVDCPTYSITAAARGAPDAYRGLTFVPGDF